MRLRLLPVRSVRHRAGRAVSAFLITASLGAIGAVAGDLPSAVAGTGGASLMPAAGQFVPINPTRVLDTQNGTGGLSGPLASGGTATYQVSGVGAIPSSGVADVYAIVNAINPSTSGCLSDYSSDISDPGICNTSFNLDLSRKVLRHGG
jgi:hypothetical protein